MIVGRHRFLATHCAWNWRSVALAAVFVVGCGDGGTTSPSVNRAPEPAGSIPDRTLQVGETAALDLSPHFADPDGDALSYAAESSAEAVVSVSVAGATLTIAGVAKGTATVTVTAADPEGLSATHTFEATVPNRAPEPTGSMPDRTLQVGETASLDLSPHFADPDGDALSYAAESSAEAVVQVSLSGATLTIAAVAKGTATVTVTAADPAGLSATHTFVATVPNRAPEPAGSMPDRTLQAGETASLDLSPHFADPDGDALSYAAESSAEAVVSVSVAGATLTIAGVAKGTATVTVTAADPAGLSATQTFEAAVPNRAPEPADPMPDRTLQVGETATLDLSPHFADPDGDALSYATESSAEAVASVSVSGATLTIAGVAKGTATVTVTARDPQGLSATQTLGVSVVPPAPDLAFTGVSPGFATRPPGASVTFTFGIRNRGTVVSEATTIRAMRSPNPFISTRDTELRSWSFSSLAPSQDHRFQLTISVGADSAPGTIYIGMCVDPVTDESNTRNNCSEGARLSITGSSSGRESVGGGLPIRIRASRLRESRRPAVPL